VTDRKTEFLNSGIHELCKRCIHKCKQHDYVNLTCSKFEEKKHGKKNTRKPKDSKAQSDNG
jgi:hypothetical protein